MADATGQKLLEEYDEIFVEELPPSLLPKRAIGHAITTDDDVFPPRLRLYQLIPAKMAAVREYINKNLRLDEIRPGMSSDGTPMFFAKDKDGSLRGLVHYRF